MAANAAAGTMLGRPPGELIGLRWKDLGVDATSDPWAAVMPGRPASFVTRWRRGDGGMVDLAVHAQVVAHDGRSRLVASTRVVTDSQRELRLVHDLSARVARAPDIEAVYDVAVDALLATLEVERCALLLFDLDGVMRFVAWRGLSDIYRAAVEGHSPWKPNTIDPQPVAIDDVRTDDAVASLREVLAAERIVALLFVPLLASGRLIGKFMVYADAPHRWEPAEVALAATVANHIAYALARSENLRALREEEERLRLAIDAAGAMAYEIDLTRGGHTVLRGAERLLGAAVTQPAAAWWRLRLHPDDAVDAEAARNRLAEAGGSAVLEYRMRHEDGTWIDVEDHVQVLCRDQQPSRLIGVVIDVTARRRAERRLREEHRRKDDFLAIVGHELRNPLSAVSNALLVMERTDAPEKRRLLHEMMARNVQQMTVLLDDLLDVRRIARGELVLNLQPTPVAPVAHAAADSVRTLVEQRGHGLSLECEADLEVQADRARLQQVLSNLLVNAVRYTPPNGSIALAAHRCGGEVEITITDDGVGIDSADVERIFEPFTRIEQGAGGLGIGLALVRQLVELHGGSVCARSAGRGRGSTFAIRLPPAAGTPADANGAAAAEA